MISTILSIYLLLNIISFIAYGNDKSRARKRNGRIPERTLLGLSVLGIFGAILGMRTFHHKTNKPTFSQGLYLILALEIMSFITFLITYLI